MIQIPKSNDKIRCLPPGVDQIDDDVVFGKMWMQVGTLKLIRTSNAHYNVICQFWGQPTPAILQTRTDLSRNEASRMQMYDIKCPPPYFKEYLQKMKHQFKFEVEGVGTVDFDIKKFLNQEVQMESSYVFEHFKGFFQVIGKGGRKAGSLEVEMGCQFDSSVVLRELGQSDCPVKDEVKDCQGQCICHEETPMKQKDERIAHSLNCKIRDDKQFEGQKYTKQEIKEEKKQIEQQDQNEEKKEFPQIPKILTYSNLKLTYNEESQAEKSQHQESLKQSQQLGEIQQEIIQTEKPQLQEKKKQLFDEFYGSGSEKIKQITKKPQPINLSPIHQQSNIRKSKLDQVVNLTEQLKKQPQLPQIHVVPEFRPMETGKKKPFKKNSIFVNLLAQIKFSTIKLTESKLLLIHKPYGQNQRVTLGPQFGDIITILCPVGEHEIRKMDKMPFIIQFWNAYTNKFIGIIKINLSKIKKGFMINNKLNQTAIKTNLFPTIIHKGSTMITDISGNKVGTCHLNAAIGTCGQLDTHLNQTNRFVSPQVPSQPSPTKSQPEVPEVKKPESPSKKQLSVLMTLQKFLSCFEAKSETIIDELMGFMRRKYVDREAFSTMIDLLEFQQNSDILWQLLSENDRVDMVHISQAFNGFKQVRQKILQGYIKKSKNIRKNTKQIQQVQKNITKESCFGIISRVLGQRIISQFCTGQISGYFDMFKQNIAIQLIQDTLHNKHNHHQLLHSNISPSYHTIIILQSLLSKLKMVIKLLIQQTDGNYLNYKQMMKKLRKYGVESNLWEILHLYRMINGQEADSVPLDKLFNWIQSESRNIEQRKENQEEKEESQRQEVREQEEEKREEKQESSRQEIKKQPSQKPKQNISKNQSQPEEEKKQQQPIYQHLFTFDAIELFLQNPTKSSCYVSYVFPYEQDRVRSKQMVTFNDKHKYTLKLYGTHGFSISDSLKNYLGDNVVKFYVYMNEKIEYQGALHTDELQLKENSEEIKVIPLFSDDSQSMVGKIKLRIGYEKKLSSEKTLGKETTYQLFLPKSGYLNYYICAQVDALKLRNQVNISEQFYVALVLDMFGEAPNLVSHFPPISSKLFSDFSAPLELQGSFKLTLSSVVLDYIKTKSALLKLNIIYYAKERANFERKEVVYGRIELPLINLIKNAGIHGDYAFKNKLGMYITLANCSLKYQKQALAIHSPDKLTKHRHDEYWILLHFLEFINFEMSKINWIKFQFIFKGKKYSTEKHYIRGDKYHLLKNSSILLNISQEQFHDTKVLPITVITNLSERLAIDINIKSMGKRMLKDNYCIHNQYFLIVNQSSQPMKMRTAVKISAFRGTSIVNNFVDLLQRHLDVDIFDEIDLPHDINNYDKMLNLWKNKLRISNRLLDDVLSQLLENKKRDKLSINMFTDQTEFKLDLTPIMVSIDADFDGIAQQLQTETKPQQLMNYLQGNSIKLINFREQFLNRFMFKELNRTKLDKNVEFLGLHEEIDLILFMKKLKFNEDQSMRETQFNTSKMDRGLEIVNIKGNDLHLLYNGIKPNVVVKFPQLSFQTEVLIRNSDPLFKKRYIQSFSHINWSDMKRLLIEVYHAPAEDDDVQDILIGDGTLNLQQLKNKNNSYTEIMKIAINSTMSGRLRAKIEFRVNVTDMQQIQPNEEKSQLNESDLYSGEGSRIGEMLSELNQEMNRKKHLFDESSDEEY